MNRTVQLTMMSFERFEGIERHTGDYDCSIKFVFFGGRGNQELAYSSNTTVRIWHTFPYGLTVGNSERNLGFNIKLSFNKFISNRTSSNSFGTSSNPQIWQYQIWLYRFTIFSTAIHWGTETRCVKMVISHVDTWLSIGDSAPPAEETGIEPKTNWI